MGADAGTKPAGPPGQSERIKIMTRKSTQTAAKTTTPRFQAARQSITFELIVRLAPHQGLTDNLVRTFGLEPVHYDTIRDGCALFDRSRRFISIFRIFLLVASR